MNEVLFSILQAVIIILATVVSRYLIPWLKLKIDTEKVTQVIEFIKSAVCGAEQIINGTGLGIEKKTYVIDLVQKFLTQKGYKISDEQINLLIEAAVLTLNSDKKITTKTS